MFLGRHLVWQITSRFCCNKRQFRAWTGEAIAKNLQAVRDALVAKATALVNQYGNQTALSASFSISPGSQGVVPFTVSAQANASANANGWEYIWDFGDGTRLVGAAAMTHVFTQSGTWHVTLTVQDSHNHTAQASQTFSVTASQSASYRQATGTPQITANPTSISIPGATLLIASGFDPGGAVQFYWSVAGGLASFDFVLCNRWNIPLHLGCLWRAPWLNNRRLHWIHHRHTSAARDLLDEGDGH